MDTVPTKCCIVAPHHVAPELADSTTDFMTPANAVKVGSKSSSTAIWKKLGMLVVDNDCLLVSFQSKL